VRGNAGCVGPRAALEDQPAGAEAEGQAGLPLTGFWRTKAAPCSPTVVVVELPPRRSGGRNSYGPRGKSSELQRATRRRDGRRWAAGWKRAGCRPGGRIEPRSGSGPESGSATLASILSGSVGSPARKLHDRSGSVDLCYPPVSQACRRGRSPSPGRCRPRRGPSDDFVEPCPETIAVWRSTGGRRGPRAVDAIVVTRTASPAACVPERGSVASAVSRTGPSDSVGALRVRPEAACRRPRSTASWWSTSCRHRDAPAGGCRRRLLVEPEACGVIVDATGPGRSPPWPASGAAHATRAAWSIETGVSMDPRVGSDRQRERRSVCLVPGAPSRRLGPRRPAALSK